MTIFVYQIWNPNYNSKYIKQNVFTYLCSKEPKNINPITFNTLKSMNYHYFKNKKKYKELEKMFKFEIFMSEHNINYIMNFSTLNVQIIDINKYITKEKKLISMENESLFIENINNNNIYNKNDHSEFYKNAYKKNGSINYYPKCIVEYLINGTIRTTITFEKKINNDLEYAILWNDLKQFPHSFLIKKLLIDLDLFNTYLSQNNEEQIRIHNIILKINKIREREEQNKKIREKEEKNNKQYISFTPLLLD